jgi:hypothetical protein
MPGERAARIEDTWWSATIEARERAPQVRTDPAEGDRSPEAALAVLAELELVHDRGDKPTCRLSQSLGAE